MEKGDRQQRQQLEQWPAHERGAHAHTDKGRCCGENSSAARVKSKDGRRARGDSRTPEGEATRSCGTKPVGRLAGGEMDGGWYAKGRCARVHLRGGRGPHLPETRKPCAVSRGGCVRCARTSMFFDLSSVIRAPLGFTYGTPTTESYLASRRVA